MRPHARRLASLLPWILPLVAGACSDRMGEGWDWNRMRTQPRYTPFDSSTFFADGKAMQAPPAGTIARESGNDGATPGAATLDDGASRFDIFCAVCHGSSGNGESVVGSNMDPPKPPSLLSPAIRALSDAQLDAVITDGFGHMPSYAAELTPADRRAVIAYLRTLQRDAR
jgi:mono/diheme cytochrome c family protein